MAEKEYIEREAAIKKIEEKQRELCPLGMFSRHAVYGSDREKFDAWEEIIEQIERIPAADVRPVVRGKWIDGNTCSLCGTAIVGCKNFCPNCGADMRGEIVEDTTSGCGRCDKCRINYTGTCRYGDENT